MTYIWLEKDLEFYKSEVEEIVKEIGHFPTKTEMQKLNKIGLYNAIKKYFGGLPELAKKLGFNLTYTPKNKYKNWDTVKSLILRLEKKIGRFPMQKDFRANGYGGLLMSLYRYYGGLEEVRKKILKDSSDVS